MRTLDVDSPYILVVRSYFTMFCKFPHTGSTQILYLPYFVFTAFSDEYRYHITYWQLPVGTSSHEALLFRTGICRIFCTVRYIVIRYWVTDANNFAKVTITLAENNPSYVSSGFQKDTVWLPLIRFFFNYWCLNSPPSLEFLARRWRRDNKFVPACHCWYHKHQT